MVTRGRNVLDQDRVEDRERYDELDRYPQRVEVINAAPPMQAFTSCRVVTFSRRRRRVCRCLTTAVRSALSRRSFCVAIDRWRGTRGEGARRVSADAPFRVAFNSSLSFNHAAKRAYSK
jgi:hypothetical protein